MPYYQFTVPSGGATLKHRAEVAAAVTRVHGEVTGAPSSYVHCSFAEVGAEGVFVAGEPVSAPRLVGFVRSGRSAEVRARLLHALADAWSGITGDRREDLAIFLQESPGENMLEDGAVLPEASEDPGAIG